MLKTKHIALVCLLLFSVTSHCLATTPKKKGHGNGVRLSFGPVIGFYSVNTNHAKNVSPRASALVGFKKEIQFGRDYKTFFLFGVDYFIHGLSFQSYYFNPDSLKLYDKSFAYKYSLFVQEINVPLQVKYSFTAENNSLFSPYLMIGYHLRYMLPANLKVTQNGNEIRSDNPDMKFKNPLLSDKMNAYVSVSLGWQRNNTASSRKGFFVELNYRYGFSQYYFDKNYAASSLFINSTHLTLQLGLKF